MVEKPYNLIIDIKPNKSKLNLVVLVQIFESHLMNILPQKIYPLINPTQHCFQIHIVFEFYWFQQSGEIVGSIKYFLLMIYVEIV